MADQQPQLFAPPPRYAYLQQPKQILEELSIQLHLRLLASMAGGEGCRASLSGSSLSQSGGLLFGDGGADAVEEGEEEG